MWRILRIDAVRGCCGYQFFDSYEYTRGKGRGVVWDVTVLVDVIVNVPTAGEKRFEEGVEVAGGMGTGGWPRIREMMTRVVSGEWWECGRFRKREKAVSGACVCSVSGALLPSV
jgi:hypothetical protein